MPKKTPTAAGYAIERLQEDPWGQKKEPFIKPSSLAKGCMLYIAFELQEKPKPPFDSRVGRILSVGTDSHRRLQRVHRMPVFRQAFQQIADAEFDAAMMGNVTGPAIKLLTRRESAEEEQIRGFEER